MSRIWISIMHFAILEQLSHYVIVFATFPATFSYECNHLISFKMLDKMSRLEVAELDTPVYLIILYARIPLPTCPLRARVTSRSRKVMIVKCFINVILDESLEENGKFYTDDI